MRGIFNIWRRFLATFFIQAQVRYQTPHKNTSEPCQTQYIRQEIVVFLIRGQTRKGRLKFSHRVKASLINV
jgi:hypothetical protein